MPQNNMVNATAPAAGDEAHKLAELSLDSTEEAADHDTNEVYSYGSFGGQRVSVLA